MKIEVGELDCKDIIEVIPQDIYTACLTEINGISFTHREMDTIACMLSGRSAKKTASFLCISPKTVENHIRNIMLKLRCRSQETIIDIMEKSGKFIFIKRYYASLLMQAIFEQTLDNIASIVNKKNLSCKIIYLEQEHKKYLIRYLERHLKRVGIKISLEVRENLAITSVMPNEEKMNDACYIIYSLPSILIGQFKKSDYPENLESTIFLVLDKQATDIVSEKLDNVRYIHLSKEKNYYFLFYTVLKKLLPGENFDKYFLEFERQYATLCAPDSLEKSSKEIQPYSPGMLNIFMHFLKKKYMWVFVSFSCVFIFLCQMMHKKTEAEFLKFTNVTSGASKEIGVLEKPMIWNLPRQDHVFIGREKFLEQLNKVLHENSINEENNIMQPNKLTIVACAGLGGIGKTQLALNYVHQTKHPYNLKAWFSGDNIQVLKQQYAEFAKVLGHKEGNTSIETIFCYIKNWLEKNPGWLLVYDNINDYNTIKEYLPQGTGSIILTTRQQNWPSNFNIIEIDVMTEEESVNLIESLTQHSIEEKEKDVAKELVKLLGYLPLALSQAGAYIKQNQISLSEYLALYKQHEYELLADNALPTGTNNLPVTVVWNISLAAINKELKKNGDFSLPLELLTVCSYLAPEGIPRNLLLEWLKKSYPDLSSHELALNKSLGLLQKYSMMNRDKDGYYTVHRLVQVILRNQHDKTANAKNSDLIKVKWYEKLLEAIYQIAPIEFSQAMRSKDEEMQILRLLPHFESLIFHYDRLFPDGRFSPSVNLGKAVRYIGSILQYIINDDRAIGFYKRALNIFEQHYAPHYDLEIIETLNGLANCYGDFGDNQEKILLLTRALKIIERYPEEIIFKGRIIHNLGAAHLDNGQPKEGQKFLEKALKIFNEHKIFPRNLVAQVILAQTHMEMGEIRKAKILLENSLKDFGENDCGKYKVVNQILLGKIYMLLGDKITAKKLIENGLERFKVRYGLNHFQVAKFETILCDLYLALGNAKKAREAAEHALAINKVHFNKNHIMVGEVLPSLGNAYLTLGKAQEAKEILERALLIQQN